MLEKLNVYYDLWKQEIYTIYVLNKLNKTDSFVLRVVCDERVGVVFRVQGYPD
jgi:hypothetical protein